MRKKLSRYLMLETRKDGTKFTSKGLKEAAERLQGISRSYDQRQHALVEQVNPPSADVQTLRWGHHHPGVTCTTTSFVWVISPEPRASVPTMNLLRRFLFCHKQF